MIELDVASCSRHRVLMDPGWVAGIRNIEYRHLRAEGPTLLRGVLADSENQTVAQRMEVGGISEDLQLAFHRWIGRIAQIEGVERIGLAEGDDVTHLTDETNREDPLTLTQATNRADDLERAVVLSKNVNGALGVLSTPPGGLGSGRGPQVSVVLAQRELVEQEPADVATGEVPGCGRVGNVELV